MTGSAAVQRHPAKTRTRRRATLAVLLSLVLPALGGCATLAGLPVSPITGAVGAGIVHNDCSGWNVLWGYPLGIVAGCLWGPIIELSVGFKADIGYMGNGEYGAMETPGFLDVFDPFGYGLTPPYRPETPPKP
jgi:hypothetical protein